MGVCVIRGLVGATLLFALSQFSEGKSTPIFLKLNSEPRENSVNSSTEAKALDLSDHHQIPSQNLQDVVQRNNNSGKSVVNAVDDEDYDTNIDYSGDFADYNDTYYEYDYDYDDDKNDEDYDDDDDYDYEDTDDDFDYNDENYDSDDNSDENYDSDDNDDENYDSDDNYDENDDSEDENDDSDDDYDYDSDYNYDDDYDDRNDTGSENQESPSNHHHHLITGQNGASIQVDDDGKVYMFLNVNETFDPSKYYLEVGNNTKLLLDLGDTLANETADYELVKHHDLDGAAKDVKGTKSSRANEKTHDIDAKERSVVLMNVDDVEDEGKGSDDTNNNKDDTKVKKMTISLGEGDKNDSNNSPGNEMFTLTPGFPNDSHISVGWSSATISDDGDYTGPPGDHGNESSYWFEGTLSPSSNDLSELATTVLDDFDRRNKDDYNLGEDDSGEDGPKSMLDMSDEELKEYIETYPELIESDDEEFEDIGTEPEMTTSALMFDRHRDVNENFNGSESLLAGNHTVSEEEQREPEAERGLTWLLIPSQSGNQTHEPTNNTDIDYSQIHREFISSNNLTNEEQLELGGLERLRRTTEALGGLSALRKDPSNHHIVRRQLSNMEACGSFSRRRRDTGLNDAVDAEGQRYKRGVSNVGRRLEMGNPAFRQLYNQYKNMCNFIAMVAFEK